ncbi:uncharacterized protein M6D78_016750 isoform 3-T5 [Vipera latastei]
MFWSPSQCPVSGSRKTSRKSSPSTAWFASPGWATTPRGSSTSQTRCGSTRRTSSWWRNGSPTTSQPPRSGEPSEGARAYDVSKLSKGGTWLTRGNLFHAHGFKKSLGRERERPRANFGSHAFPSKGVDFATRKIANMLKPQKEIKQQGDFFCIKTTSTFRNYFVEFKIGEEFDEDNKGLDNRKCRSVVTWNNDKLVCTQNGEKKNRGWSHWIEGDELYLELRCEGQTSTQVFKRA